MRLNASGTQHLTYCTNIHPGESWAEVRRALDTSVPEVKRRLGLEQEPFGVGLRLSARAVADLGEAGALDDLRDLLDRHGLYVFTLNGFPYGTFHGARVKEGVYEPDWRSRERLTYTNALADLLARFLPEGMEGSISTVPGAFKPSAAEPAAVAAITETLAEHAAFLWRLRQDREVGIALALEPEPECFLETLDEAAVFFRDHLFAEAGVAAMVRHTGLAEAEAETALRRHLGVCLDVCHAAVEYESAPEALAMLQASGIRVPKVQLSSALRLAPPDEAGLRRLADFDDGVYLHQVVTRSGGEVKRYLDLPKALADAQARAADEWRVHFHVPVFLEELDGFSSTQGALSETLEALRGELGAEVPHLEVETYTWDVLPERHRGVPVEEAIARELTWTLERLR